AGIDRLLALDLHAGQIQGFFSVPVDHLFAAPVIIDYLGKKDLRDPVIVSPDAGGVERARAIAKRLNASLAIIDKRREGPNSAMAMHLIGDVKGKDAVVIDDMIDTAGTLIQTVTVSLDPKAVLRMIHGHEGTTQLLTLKFEGETGNGARLAIIRDLQFDPVSDALLHVDLQEVSADRAITVRVAVRPVGEAAGVRDQKGILNLVLHELEVSCLPTAIPQRID